VENFLMQIQDELVHNTYQPMPVRKKEIPKDGGSKVRVLSIPAIRDRVVQGALKLILEPIFEADFQSGSYGYRPRRSAHEAVDRVAQAIVQGLTRIIDLDLRAYFTSNPTQALGAGARPNRVPGCNAELSGSAESRLNEWFNTSCFSQPNAFMFGNEPRVDSSLPQQGILNFDFAVFKRTTFGRAERMAIEFRAEFFNLFNHPQFGPPITSLPSGSFGSEIRNRAIPHEALPAADHLLAGQRHG
jgi:Reverse transcriptase (RNA-dependent DNA polymerase)